jgi:hypothetical protein
VKARPGDRIVIEAAVLHGRCRVGIVTAVGRADGGQPYRVRWLDNGHETLLLPGPRARIEPRSGIAGEDGEPPHRRVPEPAHQ